LLVLLRDCKLGVRCAPWSATKTDGNSWLLSCAWTLPVCGGPDYKALECGIDPFRGEQYWFWENECDPIPLYYYDCWTTCDGQREPTEINWHRH
jgi:hypothetical protein